MRHQRSNQRHRRRYRPPATGPQSIGEILRRHGLTWQQLERRYAAGEFDSMGKRQPLRQRLLFPDSHD